MPLYRVRICTSVTIHQEGFLEVEADEPQQAAALALDMEAPPIEEVWRYRGPAEVEVVEAIEEAG